MANIYLDLYWRSSVLLEDATGENRGTTPGHFSQGVKPD